MSSSISRTTGALIGWPTPALCESTRLRCSCVSWSSAMRVCASLPKPVLMPYTGSWRATSARTQSTLAWMPAFAEAATASFSGPAATRASSSFVEPAGRDEGDGHGRAPQSGLNNFSMLAGE